MNLLRYLPYAVGGVVALVVLSLAVSALVRRVRRIKATRVQLATWGLAIPAAMALAMSASTSYRFFGTTLGITDLTERLTMCGIAEATIIGLTIHAWAAKSKSSAWAVYVLVGAQSIPAFEVSGGAGGIMRTVLGPVLLAFLLHRLLGIEIKFSGEKSQGLLASAGREIRERLTARLGIGRRGEDSAAIARSRAADRAVALASGSKLGGRAATRLSKAIDAAEHGLGAEDAAAAEASIVDRVVRRKSIAGLHGIDARHVWRPSQTVSAVDEEAAETVEEPVLQAVAPIIYPLPQRAALPAFQTVPGAIPPQAIPFQTDEEQARKLRNKGWSFRAIGTQLGRSTSWAFRVAQDVPVVNGSKV